MLTSSHVHASGPQSDSKFRENVRHRVILCMYVYMYVCMYVCIPRLAVCHVSCELRQPLRFPSLQITFEARFGLE